MKKKEINIDKLLKLCKRNMKDLAFQLNNEHYRTCRGCKMCNEIVKNIIEQTKIIKLIK